MNHRTRVLSEGNSGYAAICSCRWIGETRKTLEDSRIEANMHEITELRIAQSKAVKAPADLVKVK